MPFPWWRTVSPPTPSPLEQIDPAAVLSELAGDGEDLPVSETCVNLVTVDVAEYAWRHFEKSVKKTLSIPAWLNEAALRGNAHFFQIP